LLQIAILSFYFKNYPRKIKDFLIELFCRFCHFFLLCCQMGEKSYYDKTKLYYVAQFNVAFHFYLFF
jgi:hypothetical protein